MRILVTGSRGQLGTHMSLLAPQSRHEWFFADVDELDITDRQAVESFVNRHGIQLVVNCAAYTNVDKAESDEAAAMRLNADAVGYLADAMEAVGGSLIHISTDYVFGGTMYNIPCTEDMAPNPTGAYGRTKLAGEEAARRCSRTIILRTSWLYSEYGKNFLLTMRRLTAEKPQVTVVFDQAGTPTYAGDLSRAIFNIIENNQLEHVGTYNYANEGVCSWYDFAHEIARQSGNTDCRVLPCHSDEYPSPVKRPAYSVLDKTKFKLTFHQEIPHWSDGLRRCISNLER